MPYLLSRRDPHHMRPPSTKQEAPVNVVRGSAVLQGPFPLFGFPLTPFNSCKGQVSLRVCKHVSPLNVSKNVIKQSSCFCNDVWLFLGQGRMFIEFF